MFHNNDAHVTIDELMERMQNDDDTLPRQITRIGSNLVNTDPYWNERKRELEAFLFYRKNVCDDLPSYFHTDSMAELHWSSLAQMLSHYLHSIHGIDKEITYQQLITDHSFLRRTILENLDIVTNHFDAHSINY